MPNLTLGINCRYQDRAGTYTGTDGQVYDYEPYFLTDARLQWEKRNLTVFIEGNNLTDISYIDYGCVPQPGIWAIAGFAIKL